MESNPSIELNFKDDEFVRLDNEFEQIQKCKGMYISYDEERGGLHLLKELINNGLDELTNEECRKIENREINIFVDEATKEYMVSDNGRGIPFENLVDVVTKKHTSTKIGRKFNPFSAGQNGCGLKLVVALSTYFSIASYRNGEMKLIEFHNCEMTEHPVKKIKKDIRGTYIKFIPNEDHLGAYDLHHELVEDWIRRLSYLIPEGIVMKYMAKRKGSEACINKKFKPSSLADNIKYLSPTLEFAPINLESVEKYNEVDEEVYDIIDMRMSFSYDKTLDGELVESYCNYVHTDENGFHVDGCRRAVCNYIVREAKKLDPNSKYEVTYDDCKRGLILVVDCKTSQPSFKAQTKNAVENKDIGQRGFRLMIKELDKYFINNQALLKKIITYLRQVVKLRLEVNKIRTKTISKPSTFLDDAEIDGFINIANRNYSGYKELFICEGKSAAGQLKNVRNPKNQAILPVFGVLDNTIGITTVKAAQLKVVSDLVKVLGCGIGPSFDLSKLRWDKIIIATDGDVDGFNIASSISAFFVVHMPELVKGGYVYKIEPPLYSITQKSADRIKHDKYLFSKDEYFVLFHELIAKSIDLMIDPYGEAKYASFKEKMEWLYLNRNYYYELDNLVTDTKALPIVLEYVCRVYLESGNDEHVFKENIEKVFPEMEYDILDNSLTGSYNRQYVNLLIDKLFFKQAKRFMMILAQNKSFFVGIKGKDDEEAKIYTIGQIMEMTGAKYDIRIESRFKGLGEITEELLRISVVNPLYRKLVQLNINDMDETIEIFNVLHNRKYPEKRREMIDNMDITYEMLDN